MSKPTAELQEVKLLMKKIVDGEEGRMRAMSPAAFSEEASQVRNELEIQLRALERGIALIDALISIYGAKPIRD